MFDRMNSLSAMNDGDSNRDEKRIDRKRDDKDSSDGDCQPPGPLYENNDLTNRFLYKVNALMGTFDPAEDTSDTETESGNIFESLLTFPSMQTFTVVGGISDGSKSSDDYVNDVKEVIMAATEGNKNNEHIDCVVTPRGSKYVKLSLTIMVDSTSVMNTIYDGLGELEQTVMRF
eukprot:CAMPEP_0194365660 /NCGR_PEP_ID=MMETSP0174-20130528/13726_1 /TAXON_ID=216777 /ORGANISM="Proboscia alata, Strain PI-D3" /LENGTH=173 /DNA_ID=CAMNT_0039140481 /DNA_START=284 /DNA_END=805 /DNA_ORIENTATION=-